MTVGSFSISIEANKLIKLEVQEGGLAPAA
jgi:hypothetical protein